MNKVSREILEKILLDESSWDDKTRELNYESVVQSMNGTRENWFVYDVFFPKLFRFNHLLHLLSTTIHSDWWEIAEIETGLEGWMCTHDSLNYDIGLRIDRMCERVWDSPEWCFEEPSKEEILALNIKPNYVPTKRLKGGVTQPSMF